MHPLFVLGEGIGVFHFLTTDVALHERYLLGTRD
jgi:hypothetical protein